MNDQHNVLQERVRKLLEERCHVRVSREHYDKNLHLDSMALLELIVGIENEFGITLDEGKLEKFYNFRSIESISQFVSKQSQT